MDEKFEEFWRAYPKRDGANPKQPAQKKFGALVSGGVDPEAIIGGARAYAEAEQDKQDRRFIAMASTWLNQRRWEDYYSALKTDRPALNLDKKFVAEDTPQWDAWRDYWLRTKRKNPPSTDHRHDGRNLRGWWFDSEWPGGSSHVG